MTTRTTRTRIETAFVSATARMFKGLTKDLTGTADICTAVTDPTKLAVGPYLLPGEQVLFAFQSGKEEFVFTNEALITLEGENATTTRKLVERYEYRECPISRVQFETTGRVDRDCEIKLHIGGKEVSIDIARKEEDAVKVYYKALIALSREQEYRQRKWEMSNDSVAESAKAMKLSGLSLHEQATTSGNTMALINQANNVAAWMVNDFDRLNGRCYKDTINMAIQSA